MIPKKTPAGKVVARVLPHQRPSQLTVGKIERVIGTATVTRSEQIFLKVGDPVFQGDIIETTADGLVCIRFIDGTTFNLSNSARMALREFPDGGTLRPALFDIARGDFAFVAGDMAKAGRLEIDTPVANIRGGTRVGGIGTLSLISLFFAAMEDVEAAPPDAARTDDETIPVDYSGEPHGSFELTTKESTPRRIYVDDPGVTWALRLNSSSELSVSQVANSPAQMAQLSAIQQSVLHTYSVGLQAMQGPTFNGQNGSTTNPNFEILPGNARPINFSSQPDAGGLQQNLNGSQQHSITDSKSSGSSSNSSSILGSDSNILDNHSTAVPDLFVPPPPPPPQPLPPPPSAPTITTTAPAQNHASSIDISGTAAANSTVTLFNSASAVGTTSADGSGSWQINNIVLADGSDYNFTATATDSAGHTSGASNTLVIHDDQTAPSAPLIVTTAPSQNTAPSIDIAGSAEANSTVTLLNGASQIGMTTADGSGNWHVNGIALVNGAHYSFTATATDAAGNTSGPSNALTFDEVQNQAPVIGNAGNTVGYTELQAVAPAIDAALTVSDADNPTLAGATVSIGGLLAGDGLNFTNQNGITGSYNALTGVLTLSGTASVAAYQAALELVTFSSISHNPTSFGTDSSRSISWAVNDGTLSSNLATTTINITAVNDAPVISNVSGSVSTNQNTPVTLKASTGTVTDVDAAPSDLLLATLSVAHGTLAPIGSVPGLTIVNGQDGSAGVLQFTGTQAALTQAIETGVSYTPALNYNGPDTLTFTVNDQGHTGPVAAQATATIGITVSADQAPVIGNAGNTVGYTELQAVAPAIDAALTVSDADNPTLAGATVSIGGLLAGDGLNFTNQNGITGSYNALTGVLTLSGTASVAAYQAALESVTFSSISHNPTSFGTDSSRSISWAVNDGTLSSTLATTTINITAVNDAPVISNVSGSVSTNQNTPVTLKASTGTVTDVDAAPSDLLLATLSVAHGTLAPIGSVPGLTIVNGQDGSAGVLQFTGTQAALTQAIETGVSYTPALNYNGPDTLTFTVNDQGHTGPVAAQATATIGITVSADQAPVIGNAGNTVGYTELQAVAPAIDAALTVSDADTPTLAGATVSIGGLLAGDGLNFTNQNGITGSYNALTGVLTLSGTASVAAYQAALESVTFSSISHNPTSFGTDSSRSISWAVNDGTLSSTLATTTINITAVNDAPVISNVSGSVSTNQNTPVTLKASTGTVTDVDAAPSDLLLATLSVAHGTLAPIGSVPGLTIVNGQDGSAGVLQFTGTQAALTQAIETGVSYTPALNYNGPDTLTFTVNDQGHTGPVAAQATATIGITVSADQAPVIGNAGNTVGYTELQAVAPAIDAALTVSDADTPTLAGATVSIGGLLAGDGLNFTNQNGITGSYNALTGVLTLSGTASVAAYQAALESVTFSSISHNPTSFGTDSSRSISWAVNDGTLSSTLATTTINITAVNDAPVISNVSGSVSTNQNTPVTLKASTGTVTDVDAAPSDLLLATLSVAHGTLAPIGSVPGLTIVNGQDGSAGVLQFTGTQAALTQAIETGVSYTPALNYNGPDTLTFTVNDQGHTGPVAAQATATIGITVSADQAPVIGNAGNTVGYTELQAVAPAIDAALTVSDADNPTLAGATVSIGGLLAGDGLNFTNQNGITGSYNALTGVLTLSGTASVAAYQAALESVTFSSISHNPTSFGTDSSRSISWAVNDGTLSSTLATTTINITAVNDAPVISNVSGSVSTNQNTPVTLKASTGTVTDVDAAPSDLLLATLSVAHGTLAPIGSVPGLTIVNGQDGSAGVLQFTGTQAALTQAIETGVSYTPALNYNGPDTLTFTVNDQGHTGPVAAQATATIGITVSADQAPVIGNAGNTVGYTELQAVAPAIDAALTVSDADTPTLAGATVSIGGLLAGDGLNFTNQNGITGSYNALTGVLTLSGTASVAAYQAALELVTFSSISHNPTSFGTDSSRSISWAVNDGTLSSTLATTTINITAVNDAPVISNVSGSVSTNQNTPVTLKASTGTVTDVDAAPSDLLLATLSVAHGTLAPIGSVPGLTIVNGQDGSAGVLQFTGTQAALTQAIETGVSYTPALNYNGPDTLTFTVNDQGHTGPVAAQATATIGITVSADQAPVIGNAGNTVGYTELQAVAPAIDAALTVSDADTPTLAGATVSIGGLLAGDGLNFTNQNGITGSYNALTGVLTLSGTASVAAYQAALESVTFSSISHNPTSFGTDSSRSISWAVNDGTLSSTLATTTINITAVNDAPVISNVSGSVSTNQNTPVTLKASTGTVTDVDAAPSDLLLATLSVAHGTLAPIGSVPGLTIVNGQDGSAGVLQFTGTQAALTQAIETGVSYTPALNYNGPDTLTFTVNDQGHTGPVAAQATATIGITVSADQAPVIGNAGNTVGYTELQAVAPAIDAALTVSDADTPTLAGATVSIGGLLAGDGLNFTNQNGITGSYNALTGVLTLSGTASVAAYQAALESVTFSSISHNPTSFGTDSSRSISWAVNDGTLSSNLATTTINITAVNDAPVISNVSGSVSTNQNTPVTLKASTGTVTDVDAAPSDLLLATLSVAHGTLAPIGSVPGLTIVNGQDGSAGVLQFTGTQAALTQAIETGVSYTPALNYNGPDTLTFTVNDQGHTGPVAAQATATIGITVSADQAPVIGNAGNTVGYTELQAVAPAIDAALTVSDADTPTLAGATVSIGGLLAGDGLNFTNQNGITGSYNALTGVLTLSGTASVAAYQAALESVTFSSISHNPTSFGTDSSRSISWAVNDGTLSSTLATTTINITAVNDAPVISNVSGSVSTNQNTPVTLKASTGTVTDVDAAPSDLLLATLSVAHGTLAPIGSVPGLTIVNGQDGSAGVLQFTGTQAALTQAIETGVSYTPALNYNGPDTLTFTVNDQGHTGPVAAQATATIGITVSADQAPVIGNAGNTVGYTELQAVAPAIDAALTVSDADTPTLAGATVSIGGLLAGDGLNFTNQNGITGSYNALTGVLTLSGTASVAAYQAALESVTFSSISHNPTSFGTDSSRSISWAVNDGTLSSNLATTTINITAVNDAPVISNVSGSVSTNQNTPVTLKASTGTVTDVDAAPSDLLLATLSVAHGTLAPIGSVPGLTIVNGQDGSAGVLQFTGTQAALTQAIETGVSYTPALNYNGPDTLTFTVNDQGHTGPVAAQATATIGITVSNPNQDDWTNTSGGNWSAASNWDNGVPISTTTAALNASGVYTVTSSGTVTISALSSSTTATLNITGGTFTVTNFTGQGPLTLSGGTFDIGNSSATVASLTQSGGELNGSGALTVTGTGGVPASNFSGGTESGAGTTTAQNGATFSSTGFGLDGGRVLQLGGSSTTSGASVAINLNAANPNTSLSDPGSGALTILSGATFTDATTGGLTISATNRGGTDLGTTAAVNNAGTFTKSGTATTSTISTLFNNSGTVDVESGTLNLSGGGADVGAVYQGPGTIEFGGGTRTLNAASSITSNALFAGNATTFTTVNGGVGTGLMTVTAGTVTFNGTVSTGGLTQSGGELNGSGTLTVTGRVGFPHRTSRRDAEWFRDDDRAERRDV